LGWHTPFMAVSFGPNAVIAVVVNSVVVSVTVRKELAAWPWQTGAEIAAPPVPFLLVAGAVTGVGLTIVANAPKPAKDAMLRQHFDEGAVHPLDLMPAAFAAHTGGCGDLLNLPVAWSRTLRV
jgi:hypothetical protein